MTSYKMDKIIEHLFLKDFGVVVAGAIHATKGRVKNQGYTIETDGKFSHKGCAVIITLPKEESPRTKGMSNREARAHEVLHLEKLKERRDYFVKCIKSVGYVAVPTIKNAEQLILTIYIKE